jgi:hypothetical protein
LCLVYAIYLYPCLFSCALLLFCISHLHLLLVCCNFLGYPTPVDRLQPLNRYILSVRTPTLPNPPLSTPPSPPPPPHTHTHTPPGLPLDCEYGAVTFLETLGPSTKLCGITYQRKAVFRTNGLKGCNGLVMFKTGICPIFMYVDIAEDVIKRSSQP